MNFFEGLKKIGSGPQNKEKSVAERYPSASPLMLEFLSYKEGKVTLNQLSNDALILVYKEKIKFYNFEVNKWNLARNPTAGAATRFVKNDSSKTIEEQDQITARVRKELNVVLGEVRRRGLPEDQPELKQDGIL